MALAFAGHGFSITSEVFPPPLTIIQGGDLLNLTFYLDYNETRDALLENSTACQELNKTTVFLKFLITLPAVFEILYPANAKNHTGNIVTDFSNCSITPSLEINSLVVGSNIPGFNVLRFDIFSQNLSWTAILDVRLRLLHSAKAGRLLNITANATVANETRLFDVASYQTPIPGNLQLGLTSTSIPETPNITLTSEEQVTLSASFKLPRITADLTLVITLPTFGNSTPMKFPLSSGSVKSLSQGIVSQSLGIGSPPQLNISSVNLHRFSHSSNVAIFLFGQTVNNNQANDSLNGLITVEVTGMVDSSQGVYVPEVEGNVTCVLNMYHSSSDIVVIETAVLTLKLGQPLLERQFMIEGSRCCHEGYNNVALTFEVTNPNISTAPALDVTIDIDVASMDIVIQEISAELCSFSNETGNQSSAYSKLVCIDLTGTEMLTNTSSALTVNLSR